MNLNSGKLLLILIFLALGALVISGRGGWFRRLLLFVLSSIWSFVVGLARIAFGFALLAGISFAVYVVAFNILLFDDIGSVTDLFNPQRYSKPSNPARAQMAGGIAAVTFLILFSVSPRGGAHERVRHLRGRLLSSYSEVVERLRRKERESGGLGDTYFWSYLDLPIAEATGHHLVQGAIGSGKSVNLMLAMKSLVPLVGQRRNLRVLVYDPKGEFFPMLKPLAESAPIHILNPFDRRSVAWNMAVDIDSPAAAYQVATALIPDEQGSQAFWVESTRHILATVIESLVSRAPGHWTLRDVLLILRYPDRVRQVLALNPETAHVWGRYAGDERTLANLFSTISSKLRPFEVVASLWDHAESRISLREWAVGESVIVLGESTRFKTSLEPINKLILDFTADELLEAADNSHRRTFLFLDELREFGKVNKLHALSNTGRSKGVVLFLGFQDISGLRLVYGDKGAAELVGQIHNKILLRTDGAETAQWVQEHFGKAEYEVTTTGVSWSTNDGKSSSTETTNVSIRIEDVVMASQVMGMPKPSLENGFHSLHDVPSLGAFRTAFSFAKVIDALPKADPAVPQRDPRPDAEQILTEWTPADLQRLHLPESLLKAASPFTPEPVEPIAPSPAAVVPAEPSAIAAIWSVNRQ
jgi:type IV secretory pathway TraG/TraD family ATPase VirD4